MLKINNGFTQFWFGIYSILVRDLLNSSSEFTQFWFGIYLILARNLLNSGSEFTQFWFEFYSIWAVKILNSFCPSKYFRATALKTWVGSRALRKRRVEDIGYSRRLICCTFTPPRLRGFVLFEQLPETGQVLLPCCKRTFNITDRCRCHYTIRVRTSI